MAWFRLGKKKDETSSCGCSSNSACKREEISGDCCPEAGSGVCCIKVLGTGCKSCHAQYEYAKEAVKAMGLSVNVEYITDMEKVTAYGVMRMPAVVVNETVVSAGKILKAEDIQKLLR